MFSRFSAAFAVLRADRTRAAALLCALFGALFLLPWVVPLQPDNLWHIDFVTYLRQPPQGYTGYITIFSQIFDPIFRFFPYLFMNSNLFSYEYSVPTPLTTILPYCIGVIPFAMSLWGIFKPLPKWTPFLYFPSLLFGALAPVNILYVHYLTIIDLASYNNAWYPSNSLFWLSFLLTTSVLVGMTIFGSVFLPVQTQPTRRATSRFRLFFSRYASKLFASVAALLSIAFLAPWVAPLQTEELRYILLPPNAPYSLIQKYDPLSSFHSYSGFGPPPANLFPPIHHVTVLQQLQLFGNPANLALSSTPADLYARILVYWPDPLLEVLPYIIGIIPLIIVGRAFFKGMSQKAFILYQLSLLVCFLAPLNLMYRGFTANVTGFYSSHGYEPFSQLLADFPLLTFQVIALTALALLGILLRRASAQALLQSAQTAPEVSGSM